MEEAYSTERLADAVASLTKRVSDADVRAELHALSGIIRNLGSRPPDAAHRHELEARLGEAMAAGDEQKVVVEMRRLAAFDRAPLRPVDWSAASRG